MKCRYCGSEISENARTCPDCGKPVERRFRKPDMAAVKSKASSLAGAVSTAVGDARRDIHFRDLFTEIFKKHSRQESGELFICGTEKTTPSERSMIAEWPKPWLHSRVFAALLAMTLLLMLMIRLLRDVYAVPSLLFVGGLMVPFSLMIFFWECNIPRNISVARCAVMFFLGGTAVLILAETLDMMLPDQTRWPFFFSVLAALADFLSLALLIVLFVKRLAPKYILNGVCIGSCVGGGFAMLLFVGFLFTGDTDFNSGSVFLDQTFIKHFFYYSLFSLCVLNLGAMIGGGLVDAMDGAPFRFGVLKDVRFLRTAVPAVVLLMLYYLNNIKWGLLLVRLLVAALSAAAVLLLISAGQKQCVRICHAAWEAEAPEGDEEEELD